jgi:hypothetical protein
MSPNTVTSGDPSSPYFPIGLQHGPPTQSDRAAVDFLLHQTAQQAWLRNRSPGPGVCPGARSIKPKLIAPYTMARMGMKVNMTGFYTTPVDGRAGEVLAVGTPHKIDKRAI